jgi:hypothetical protein
MYNQNEFEINEHGNVIVTLEEGAEVNYGRLRLITSESGRMLVTDLRNYGDVVEIFGSESLSMELFDGRANFKLTIQVGDEGLAGTFRFWPVVNEDVDPLCRLFAVQTGKRVTVESMARILAAYEGWDRGQESVEKSHGLDNYYEGIDPDVIEATTWPRIEMTFDLAKAILAESIRDELRDHAFGDKELYWRNKYGHLIATGYYGRDSTDCAMAGFDVHFDGVEARELVGLGTLGDVERNDSLDDNE